MSGSRDGVDLTPHTPYNPSDEDARVPYCHQRFVLSWRSCCEPGTRTAPLATTSLPIRSGPPLSLHEPRRLPGVETPRARWRVFAHPIMRVSKLCSDLAINRMCPLFQTTHLFKTHVSSNRLFYSSTARSRYIYPSHCLIPCFDRPPLATTRRRSAQTAAALLLTLPLPARTRQLPQQRRARPRRRREAGLFLATERIPTALLFPTELTEIVTPNSSPDLPRPRREERGPALHETPVLPRCTPQPPTPSRARWDPGPKRPMAAHLRGHTT